jgi:hypothetical protein
MPPLTVLLCVHNGARYLRAAIESILAQTCREFEFLVVDDASTDDSAAIVTSFADERIRLLRNERNLGLTASLNRGLREARGEFIARQDADDLSAPARFEAQLGVLRAQPELALVGSQGWAIDAQGHTVGRLDVPLHDGSIRWALPLLNPCLHTAVMFRREAILSVGGYDEAYPSCQDFELWTRVAARFQMRNLPERLVSYRMHGESISTTRKESSQRLVRQVVERELERLGRRGEFSDEEVSQLARFRWGVEPGEVAAMRGVIQRLRGWATEESADLRRTLAWVYAQFGYGLLSRAAFVGLREILRATVICPRYGITLPWPKIVALALLGDRARRVFLALRGKGAAPAA